MATLADFAVASSAMLPTLSLGEAGTRKVACAGDWIRGVYGVRGVAIRGGTLDEASVDLSVAGVDFELSSKRLAGVGLDIYEGLLAASREAMLPAGPAATPGRDAGLRGGSGSDMFEDHSMGCS